MFQRITVQTAGESHGKGVLVTLTGLPAGLAYDAGRVDAALARRQLGYGRSSRQRLEHDQAEVLAGVVAGRLSGAPLVLAVWNQDRSLDDKPPVQRPRPGHADLAGGCKYGQTDMRPVLERASGRETAARVAAGAVAAGLLSELGVQVLGRVVALGGVEAAPVGPRTTLAGLTKRVRASDLSCHDREALPAMRTAVDRARKAGDTLGGVIEVCADGVPPGLGSLTGFGTRLDARLGAALLSIQAIKAVELGDGLAAAAEPGSQVHDPVLSPGPQGPRRGSNRAGGIEGGMSNGQPVLARAWMKPLSMLRKPLRSWDYGGGTGAGGASEAFFERSDVTAVPAAAVVGEAMLALVLADALLEKTGGDALPEVARALKAHRRDVARRFGRRA
ncbi:MAG: chorismate synthase [Planctomycetota bacterium]|nr:MAG: chorismate synthase [Planctomycetota bacterium]